MAPDLTFDGGSSLFRSRIRRTVLVPRADQQGYQRLSEDGDPHGPADLMLKVVAVPQPGTFSGSFEFELQEMVDSLCYVMWIGSWWYKQQ